MEHFKLYSLNLSCTVVSAFMPFPRFLFSPLQHINCSSPLLVILIYFNQPFTISVKEIVISFVKSSSSIQYIYSYNI